jgi:hypothetical protein
MLIKRFFEIIDFERLKNSLDVSRIRKDKTERNDFHLEPR